MPTRRSPCSESERVSSGAAKQTRTSDSSSVKWLFKSEPHEYSIQDLREKPNGESVWDGIRNFEAARQLTEMKCGDRCYFYHSSCKDIGIVGIVEVIKEAFPDPMAQDPKSKYYDAKATPEKPRWFSIEIKLVEIWNTIVTLKDLKDNAGPGLPLSDLMVVKRGRLSVSRVKPEEYDFIQQIKEAKKGSL